MTNPAPAIPASPNPTLRIAHYLPSLDPEAGGPIRAVSDLARGLAARGHAVTLLTTQLPPAERSEHLAGAKPILLDGPVRILSKLDAAQLARAREYIQGCDLLHVHGTWHRSNVQLGDVARTLGKPYVVSPRGMLDDWCMAQRPMKKRIYWMLLGRQHFEQAGAVHCTADGELMQSKKWFPRGNGVVIHNFLDLSPYRALPGPEQARAKFPVLASGKPSVLFLSRIHVKKGLDVFLEAASIAQRAGVDVTWVVAGTGDAEHEHEMSALATKLGVEAEVLWTGHVGGTLKTSLYQACTLFALPTSQENFGFVFPECLASGTPVITTKGVDIWPELASSGAVEIVERTPEAFAETIMELLRDRPRRLEMARKAAPFVFREFDDDRLLSKFEALYRTCVERGGK